MGKVSPGIRVGEGKRWDTECSIGSVLKAASVKPIEVGLLLISVIR